MSQVSAEINIALLPYTFLHFFLTTFCHYNLLFGRINVFFRKDLSFDAVFLSLMVFLMFFFFFPGHPPASASILHTCRAEIRVASTASAAAQPNHGLFAAFGSSFAAGGA